MSETEIPDDLIDSWRGTELRCRIDPPAGDLRRMLDLRLGSRVRWLDETMPRDIEIVVVGGRQSMRRLDDAHAQWPRQPLLAVLADCEAARVIEALAGGADGVIAASDSPAHWFECLNILRGGSRWVGGPALGVQLEGKGARYDVARGAGRNADVTMRTTLFVKDHVADRIRS
jgi:hypothetical protein